MIRADRTLTLALAKTRRCFPPRGRRLPILMYHSASPGDDTRAHPYYRTNTTPERFAQQMQWLADNSYSTPVLHADLARESTSAANEVVLTFDDGFAEILTDIAPVLSRHGFTATVFLPTGFIGEQRMQFLGRPCLTWSEVRELRRAGIRFGSHTVRHLELVRLPPDEVRRELTESRDRIAQELGEPITAFSYPFAFPEAHRAFVGQFRALLVEAGYTVAVTTRIGSVAAGDDPLTLKRLPVNSLDDEPLFAAKLAGAYDWLGGAQRFAKILNRCIHPGKTA